MQTIIRGLVAVLLVVMPLTAVSAKDQSLNEIVITAQKRKQRLQDVPIQVNVFTAKSIEDFGIKDTTDFVRYVPNMTFDRADTYRNSFVVIRGIAQVTNADPPIAVIVDGVPQSDQKQFNMRLFDIQQIQVLKGPQGTLYGRDAIGGAVIITTKPPSKELTAFGDVVYGNGQTVNATGGLSGPLGTDSVLFRLGANYISSGGLIQNDYLNNKADFIHYDYTILGSLRMLLAQDWTIDLHGQFRRFSASSNQYSWVGSENANDFVQPTYSFRPNSTGFSQELSVKVEGRLGFATVSWITGYSRITETNRADLDFSNPIQDPTGFLGLGFQAGQGQDLDDKIYSEDVRLVSSTPGPLHWVAGAYYQYADKSLQTRAFVDLNGSPKQIFNPTLAIVDSNGRNHNRSWGVFTQIDYSIRHHWTVSAGFGLDHDTRERRDLTANPTTFRNAAFQAWVPKITVSYKPTKNRMFYLTWSTGYRPGGFNATSLVPVYAREYLRNYELGFKTVNWNDRLTLNGAIFYEHDDGYQYYYVNVATAAQIDQNIAQADIKGVELEAQLYIRSNWLAFGNFGYDDGVVKKLREFPQFVGNHTPFDTLWSGVLGTEYRGHLTGSLGWYGRADMEFYGKKYWQLDNHDVQDPKHYLNLRVGLEAGRWSAYLWGKNVTDTRAYSEYVSPSLGIGQAGLGFLVPPATYGIEFHVKY